MAFQEIGGARTYHKYTNAKVGEVLVEGSYTKKDSNHYGVYYEITTEEGVVHVLNKSGQLDYRMKDISLEDYIRVTYIGKELMPSGPFKGKEVNCFKVERDMSRSGKRKVATLTPDISPDKGREESTDSLEDLL